MFAVKSVMHSEDSPVCAVAVRVPLRFGVDLIMSTHDGLVTARPPEYQKSTIIWYSMCSGVVVTKISVEFLSYTDYIAL